MASKTGALLNQKPENWKVDDNQLIRLCGGLQQEARQFLHDTCLDLNADYWSTVEKSFRIPPSAIEFCDLVKKKLVSESPAPGEETSQFVHKILAMIFTTTGSSVQVQLEPATQQVWDQNIARVKRAVAKIYGQPEVGDVIQAPRGEKVDNLLTKRSGWYGLKGENAGAEFYIYTVGTHPKDILVHMSVNWVTHGFIFDDWVDTSDRFDATNEQHKCPPSLVGDYFVPAILWSSLLCNVIRTHTIFNETMNQNVRAGHKTWINFHIPRFFDAHTRSITESLYYLKQKWRKGTPDLKLCAVCAARELLALSFNDMSDFIQDLNSGEKMNSFFWPAIDESAEGMMSCVRHLWVFPCTCGHRELLDSYNIGVTLSYGLSPRWGAGFLKPQSSVQKLKNGFQEDSRQKTSSTAPITWVKPSGTWHALIQSKVNSVEGVENIPPFEKCDLSNTYFSLLIDEKQVESPVGPILEVEELITWAKSQVSDKECQETLEVICTRLIKSMDEWTENKLSPSQFQQCSNFCVMKLLDVTQKFSYRDYDICRRTMTVVMETYCNSWMVAAVLAIDEVRDFMKQDGDEN